MPRLTTATVADPDQIHMTDLQEMEDAMPTYLTIHQENDVDRVTLESRWTEISRDRRAAWQMTLFNVELGKRFCEWEAPNKEVIEQIFKELGIKWSEILEVGVTISSRWRVWEIQSGKTAGQRS
jgi:hypothetical protein